LLFKKEKVKEVFKKNKGITDNKSQWVLALSKAPNEGANAREKTKKIKIYNLFMIQKYIKKNTLRKEGI
tara:strand:- start:128 stop:334 length:207 start_codon:yes stop_codon:yes gene_type:complete